MNYYETQESTYFNTNPNPDFNRPAYPNPNRQQFQNPERTAFDAPFNGGFTDNGAVQSINEDAAVPETVENTLFVPGFLQTQIGKLMRVEFLVGNIIQDRVGILRQVGASYIIIQPVGEYSMIMCDLFSIRFATIINRSVSGEEIIVT